MNYQPPGTKASKPNCERPSRAMHAGLRAILFLALPVQIGLAQDSESTASSPFPASSAIAEGISPEGLKGLGNLIQSFVDDDEIVGGELLVIKNGKSVLHEAYGLRNRETAEAMEVGSVFCIRSMTKPLVGTSILMLIDDDRLELDDLASAYLPAFDVDGLRDITIEHLLTHTSGLPMSQILSADLSALEAQGGIMAVANLSRAEHLQFAVGEDFSYSDQGTDTLTAIIEVVTGETPARFLEKRLFEPLGMRETTCVMDLDHPLRERGCSKYVGSKGSWTNFWDTSKPPLFPFLLGSQSVYSSLTDYARFLEFWDRKGRVGRDRLLGSRYMRKALTPNRHTMGASTGLPGLLAEYGYLMQLWTGPDEKGSTGRRELVAFGHTGSDGTHAWAFPEQDAMVLYFTQSRNNTTGLRVEELLGDLLLGVPFDPNQAAPPFDDYLGYYREDQEDMYRAIIRDGSDLALEVLARGVVPLSYVGEDRWKLRPNPSVVLEFDRAESGEVTGYHIGDHYEYRFTPASHLPSPGELTTRIAATHRMDLLETLGPLRMQGALEIPKLNVTGETSSVTAWPNLFRVDNLVSGQAENYAFDGEKVRYSAAASPVSVLDGLRADSLREDHIIARFGDWNRFYTTIEVIQRIPKGLNGDVFLVRMGDTSAPATTLYVEASSSRVVREDRMTFMPGMGRIGLRSHFSDFRDVEGMLLPFRSETQVANPMIGTIEATVNEFELGAACPEGTFELEN